MIELFFFAYFNALPVHDFPHFFKLLLECAQSLTISL